LRTPLTSTAGSFMKSREAELRDLVRDWLRKADLDCDVAARLVSEGDRFRDIVAFHCQQAVEKYLKSILVRHQVEFRKTHDIERLLYILRGVEPSIAEGLAGAKWLTPFGVDIRYPGDFPETLPGDETRALGLAQGAKEAAMALLSPFLAEFDSAKVDPEAEALEAP
jgi:HEPN domain-containing protein